MYPRVALMRNLLTKNHQRGRSSALRDVQRWISISWSLAFGLINLHFSMWLQSRHFSTNLGGFGIIWHIQEEINGRLTNSLWLPSLHIDYNCCFVESEFPLITECEKIVRLTEAFICCCWDTRCSRDKNKAYLHLHVPMYVCFRSTIFCNIPPSSVREREIPDHGVICTYATVNVYTRKTFI